MGPLNWLIIECFISKTHSLESQNNKERFGTGLTFCNVDFPQNVCIFLRLFLRSLYY